MTSQARWQRSSPVMSQAPGPSCQRLRPCRANRQVHGRDYRFAESDACSSYGVAPPLLFAHIHKGAKGTSGNIVVALPGSSYQASGCVPASSAILRTIEADPHGYYVNIHSKKYPGGAIRAQL